MKMLFNYEEQPDLICFSDENDDIFPSDYQKSNTFKEIQHKTMINLHSFQDHSENEDGKPVWIFWPSWNECVSIADMMEAYEETYKKKYLDINIQEVFWEDRKQSAGRHCVPWVPNESDTTRKHRKIQKISSSLSSILFSV